NRAQQLSYIRLPTVGVLAACNPPCTSRIAPVVHAAASEDRYTAAPPKSDGNPDRPIAMPRNCCAARSGSRAATTRGVSTAPGAITFTRTAGANSTAMARLKLTFAALAAPYSAKPMPGGVSESPPVDDTLMMQPLP